MIKPPTIGMPGLPRTAQLHNAGYAAGDDQKCEQPKLGRSRLDLGHETHEAQADRQQEPGQITKVAVCIDIGRLRLQQSGSHSNAGKPCADRHPSGDKNHRLEQALFNDGIAGGSHGYLGLDFITRLRGPHRSNHD